jgi:hypothetical protein
MDTHGHEEVAKAAGLPLLEAAFNPRMGAPRLEAFYLGNWLTDVSQVIDPKVGPKAKLKGHTLVDKVRDALLNNSFIPKGPRLEQLADFFKLPGIVNGISNETKQTIDAFVDWVLKPPDVTPPVPSRLFKLAQAALLLKGYFKFVHPNEVATPGEPVTPDQLPKMDLPSYLAVFDAQFTQYYPHEHLDRPEKENPVPAPSEAEPQYADEIAAGPTTAAAPQTPDLYQYLRDDMEYLAGALTKLDLKWARKYLAAGGTPPRDDDIEWNLGLAQLGHAVHGVEDFFAHSNFIEHAATVMGGDFLPAEYQPYNSRVLKRLKRYNYLVDYPNWLDADAELHVVTGYFDFIDTLNSLAHMAADNLLGVLDRKSHDFTEEVRFVVDLNTNPVQTSARKADKYYHELNKYYHELMELFEDPKNLLDEDTDNLVAQAVRDFLEEVDDTLGESVVQKMIKFSKSCEQGEVDQATMIKLIQRMPLFTEILDQQKPAGPWKEDNVARILGAFYDLTLMMRQTYRFAGYSFSVYKLMKSLTELIEAPTVWLEKKLKEKVKGEIINYMKDSGIYLSKEIFLYSWGSMRLGCHSLLSKDHKVHEEHLYKPMSDCAKLVHHAVVKTMMRWAGTEAEPNYDSRPDNQKWVDWRALLEHYLIHPGFGVISNTEKEVLTDVLHVPTEEERGLDLVVLMKKLILKYQPTGMLSDDDLANLKKCWDATLTSFKQRKTMHPIEPGSVIKDVKTNLELPIVGILVPCVSLMVNTWDPTQGIPKWYMPVMRTNDWELQQNNHPANLVYHASKEDADKALEKLKAKRIELENSYNR